MDKSYKVTRMRYQYKGQVHESKISSRWDQVRDTDLGHINLGDFKRRIYNPLATDKAMRMIRNGIAQAAVQ